MNTEGKYNLRRKSSTRRPPSKKRRTKSPAHPSATTMITVFDASAIECMICTEKMYLACSFVGCNHMICMACAVTMANSHPSPHLLACNASDIAITEHGQHLAGYYVVQNVAYHNIRSIAFYNNPPKCPMCNKMYNPVFTPAPKTYDDLIDACCPEKERSDGRKCKFCNVEFSGSYSAYRHMFLLECPHVKMKCPFSTKCYKEINIGTPLTDDTIKLGFCNLGAGREKIIAVNLVNHFLKECTAWPCFRTSSCGFHGTIDMSLVHQEIGALTDTISECVYDIKNLLNTACVESCRQMRTMKKELQALSPQSTLQDLNIMDDVIRWSLSCAGPEGTHRYRASIRQSEHNIESWADHVCMVHPLSSNQLSHSLRRVVDHGNNGLAEEAVSSSSPESPSSSSSSESSVPSPIYTQPPYEPQPPPAPNTSSNFLEANSHAELHIDSQNNLRLRQEEDDER